MKISNLFNSGKTVFSFEVFPPKKTSPIESVYGKLEEISALKPDFISVTYSAGGSGSKSRTCEIATKIKRDFGVESVAHLTCINSTKADIDRNLALFKENGIENILALRGDRVEGVEPQKDFTYASDLCRYIASQGDFDIAGACYPEVHSEATDEVEDIHNLRKKVESGIMPVTSKSQIERMVSMCGASLPAKFAKIMQKYDTRPEALRDAGIAYAVDQIVELIAHGVDGIHLSTMNNPYVARKITEAVSSLL